SIMGSVSWTDVAMVKPVSGSAVELLDFGRRGALAQLFAGALVGAELIQHRVDAGGAAFGGGEGGGRGLEALGLVGELFQVFDVGLGFGFEVGAAFGELFEKGGGVEDLGHRLVGGGADVGSEALQGCVGRRGAEGEGSVDAVVFRGG